MDHVVATGLFSLGGVFLGALLIPLTQLFLEWMRERRAANRAKGLVAAELLHAELILGSVSKVEHWPPAEDVNAFLPTSAWKEYRSSLVGKVDGDLFDQLVLAYATLEMDRTRFVLGHRAPPERKITAEEADSFRRFSYDLGRLRRNLGGGGGGWLDQVHDEFKPRLHTLNEAFKRRLDGLSDDDLKKDDVIAELKHRAKELGELNRALGDGGAWSAEVHEEIERRLKVHRVAPPPPPHPLIEA